MLIAFLDISRIGEWEVMDNPKARNLPLFVGPRVILQRALGSHGAIKATHSQSALRAGTL